MNYVNTVTGPVAASELGRTLMHEHFLFGFCGFQGDATLGGFKEEVDEDKVELTPCQTAKCGKNHTRHLLWCAAHTEVNSHADKHDPGHAE